MASTVGNRPDDVRTDVDRLCAGSSPAGNGLEERLDMIVAQLSVIAMELNKLNERLQWMR